MANIETVEAEVYLGETKGGATEPSLFKCVRFNGQKVDVVVKCTWSMCTVHDLAREVVGCLLASELGFPVGEPVLVEIPNDLIDALHPVQPALATKLRHCAMPAFGSVHLGAGFTLCGSAHLVSGGLAGSAAEVWAFDQLVLNPDRNARKPNCLTDGAVVALIDHEKALNSYGVGGLVPAPWEDRWQPETGHLFQGIVEGSPFDLSRLETAWDQMHPEAIDKLLELVPNQWQADESKEAIRSYLRELYVNRRQAFANLRKVLP